MFLKRSFKNLIGSTECIFVIFRSHKQTGSTKTLYVNWTLPARKRYNNMHSTIGDVALMIIRRKADFPHVFVQYP